jgi:hypothetical protein
VRDVSERVRHAESASMAGICCGVERGGASLGAERHRFRNRVVERYTAYAMTKESDKLVAVAGVARWPRREGFWGRICVGFEGRV